MTHRILIVVHGYPPTARAGAEIHAWRSALGFAARGLDIRVLTFEKHAAGPIEWADSVQDGIPVRRLSGDIEWGQDPFQASYDNQAVALAMADLAAQWRPHLVYLFSGYLMSSAVVRVAADLGIPVVINLTDYWWFCHQINLLDPERRPMRRADARRVHAMLRGAQAALAAAGGGDAARGPAVLGGRAAGFRFSGTASARRWCSGDGAHCLAAASARQCIRCAFAVSRRVLPASGRRCGPFSCHPSGTRAAARTWTGYRRTACASRSSGNSRPTRAS